MIEFACTSVGRKGWSPEKAQAAVFDSYIKFQFRDFDMAMAQAKSCRTDKEREPWLAIARLAGRRAMAKCRKFEKGLKQGCFRRTEKRGIQIDGARLRSHRNPAPNPNEPVQAARHGYREF